MPYKNPEQEQEYKKRYNKQWRLNHPESHKEYVKTHREQVRISDRKYCQTHRELRALSWKNWYHSPKGRTLWKKRKNKRKRDLGWVELNYYFKGAVGHHINKEYVIYIPEELHNSVHHNVWTGQGMAEINDKAFEWLGVSIFR